MTQDHSSSQTSTLSLLAAQLASLSASDRFLFYSALGLPLPNETPKRKQLLDTLFYGLATLTTEQFHLLCSLLDPSLSFQEALSFIESQDIEPWQKERLWLILARLQERSRKETAVREAIVEVPPEELDLMLEMFRAWTNGAGPDVGLHLIAKHKPQMPVEEALSLLAKWSRVLGTVLEAVVGQGHE